MTRQLLRKPPSAAIGSSHVLNFSTRPVVATESDAYIRTDHGRGIPVSYSFRFGHCRGLLNLLKVLDTNCTEGIGSNFDVGHDEWNLFIFLCSRQQICPGLNANEIQIPYDKHHKVSSLVKRHQNTRDSVKYEVI